MCSLYVRVQYCEKKYLGVLVQWRIEIFGRGEWLQHTNCKTFIWSADRAVLAPDIFLADLFRAPFSPPVTALDTYQ